MANHRIFTEEWAKKSPSCVLKADASGLGVRPVGKGSDTTPDTKNDYVAWNWTPPMDPSCSSKQLRMVPMQ